MEQFGQQNHKGGFARSPQGYVPHAHDFAGKRGGAKNPQAVEMDARADQQSIKKRKQAKGREKHFPELTFFRF
jgi:hypothetical protein